MDILQGVYTLAQISQVTIDSLTFRLHCNATVILLISFSIVVSTREYVGNPIDCANSKEIPEETLNTYCWIHSTYTVPKGLKMIPGRQVPHPGVMNSDLGEKKHMKYYQWVAFTLFFQMDEPYLSQVHLIPHLLDMLELIHFEEKMFTRLDE